jgi:hypothetical protein
MNNPPDKHTRLPQSRLRFTYVVLVLSLALLIIASIYSAWSRNSEHEANMPVPALETVVVALRTFHQQTGRFPTSFRELDERLWKGARRAQISEDGTSLNAPASRYYYTLHTLNPPRPGVTGNAPGPIKAAIWAVPTGPRAGEAATYFWYVAPGKIERWMGPALTPENIGAVKMIPSEQQLALLVMTHQPSDNISSPAKRGIFSIFGF